MKKLIFTLALALITSATIFAADYYWVGGTGNWNDFAAHWATTSGGATFHTQAPTELDHVYFDANSFTASGQIVTINVDAYCADMVWTGALNNPELAGATTRKLYIYGSLTFINAMNFSYLGEVYFQSLNTGRTLTSAGQSFKRHVYFQGLGGYVLQDNFVQTGNYTVYLNQGTLDLNDQQCTVNIFSTNNTNVRSLQLRSSELVITSTSGSAFVFRGENLTLNAGTSLVRFTGVGGSMNHSGNYGPGQVFNDVIYEALTGTSAANNSGGSFNNLTFNSNGNLSGGMTVAMLNIAGNSTISSNGNNITTAVINGNATINNNGTYGDLTVGGNATINGNNIIGNLTLSPGKYLTLNDGTTQNFTGDLSANGTCSAPITIQADAYGSQATISKSSGFLSVNYCLLRDISGSGGASFTAANSIDLGNNSGWLIIPPTAQNYYWVGGSGSWNEPAHWSATSGGPGGTCIPTAIDNVFFDASSFSSPGQTVTIVGNDNGIAYCKSMNWSGVTNNPVLVGTGNDLYIYGSLILSANMTFNYEGRVYLKSTAAGNNIFTAGVPLDNNDIYFYGSGGGWTLIDDLNLGSETLYLVEGALNTNNQNVVAGIFNSNYSGITRALNLGSSEITLSSTSDQALRFHPTGMTFDAGTSLIRFTGAGSGMYNVSGSGLAFHDVVFEALTGTVNVYNNGSFNDIVFNSAGTSTLRYGNTVNSVIFSGTGGIYDNNNNVGQMTFLGTATISGNGTYGHVTMNANGAITGNNTIGTLVFTAGNQYTLTASRTQTILNDLIAEGTETEVINIISSSSGNVSTFYKDGDPVVVNYVSLKDNAAAGSATFTANNSIDLGNNPNWIINAPGGKDFYWIGGTGNWDNPANWSLSSGGPAGTGIPTVLDNVFFDGNSFSAPGQVVTLIGDASSNVRFINMDWTGATNNPTLAGAAGVNLRIHGSLTLIPDMIYNALGPVYFHATEPGQTITTAGVVLDKNNMYFSGDGGVWTLQDELNIGIRTLFLEFGTLNPNNQDIVAGIFNSNYSGNTRALILGSSEITLSSTSDQALRFHPTGMTFDAGTSLIRFTGAGSGMYNVSGSGLAFHDVVFEALTGTVNVYNNGSFNDIVFNSAGTSTLRYGNTVNSVIFSGTGGIYDNNNNVGQMTFLGTATISGNGTYGHVTMNANGAITGNNTIGTLVFTAGNQYTLTASRTQTILNDLIAEGTETELIVIKSSTLNSATTFYKEFGAVEVNYVSLQDNSATGGATFTAYNSVDIGGNSGWTILSPGSKDYYWVGGTGNWNDASKWSLTSGGPVGTGLPTANDNVFFDANSFTAPGQVVTIIGDVSNNARVVNMDWTGAAFNPTLAGASNQNLRISGSMILSPGMTVTFVGAVYFEATETGKTITMAGTSLGTINNLYFQGEGGGWTMMDGLNIGGKFLYLVRGSLNTNNQPVTAGIFISDYSGNVRSLTLGSSEITLSSTSDQALRFHATGMTFDAGTSLIRFTGVGSGIYNVSGSGLAFHDVVFEALTGTVNVYNNGSFNDIVFNSAGTSTLRYGNTVNSVIFSGTGGIYDNNTISYVQFKGNGTINGNNTFGILEFAPGNTYTITGGRTQTINDAFLANGTCAEPIIIESSSATATTIEKTAGTVTVTHCYLEGITASGGADFIAENSVDGGNNTGWIFIESVQNLYWVGGTGNWNDIAHWASESGGVGGYCLPTQLDNVIFDGNSFTQTGQAVYVDIADAMCHNMDWSAAAFEPTFTSLSNTYHLTIFGSLSLSPDMNFAFSGPVYFQGEAPEKSSYEIAMAGNSFNNAVYFTGEGGIWTLMDNFTIPSNDLYLNKGTLNTNGRTLSVRRFYSDNNNIRALNLGASVLNIGSNHSLAWFATGSNFTINPGTSEIRFTTANGSFYSLGESVLTYHNVVFQNPGGTSNLQSDDQFNNVTFQPAGKVLGNGTFNNVLFIGNGEINQNNTFGDVTFMNNATIKGSNTFNNLNLTPGKLCQMEAGQTQTILNDLTFWGNADNPITLQSFTIGSQATISKADGIVSGNYIVLKDMLATGGATFNVYNSTDNGNNTGWNFLEPPFATCPEDFDVCENVNPFVLDMADPSGWDYSGEGVYYDPIGEVYMFDPSLVPVGPVTITYTIGGLFPGSCDFIITILPLPVAECIPDIEVCEDTDYIFLYEGIGQYYYDGDPISGFNPVDPGVFPIIFEVTNSCGAATCTFDIIVYAKPEAAISGDLEICQGETTTLTASAGTEYLWSTGETTQSIMVSVAGDYSVEVTGENGCENSAEVTVIVHPLPVVTISGDLEICQSESTTLTASSGSSYLWSTSETTQSIEVSTGGLYSVEVTDANGCKNTAQVTVIVHPLPVVTISGDLEICQGESTTLTASSGSSYLWSTDETIQSIEVSTGGLYSVEVTDANGCKNTEQVTVIVHPLPEVSITGELTFCEGQSTVLTASAGASYLWSTEETTQSITVTMAGLYSVVVTDENGCDGSAQVTTTYLPITIPTCPATMNVIVTEPPFELTGGLPAGGTYSGVGVTNNIFNPAVAGIGNFPITYLIQDVCGPQSCEFMIIVSEEPITCLDATISNFPADVDDVCYDESYSVDFSGVVIENAIEVIWTVIPAEAGFVENNIFVLNPGILGDVTIQLLAVAEDPCQDAQASVGFTVKPLPGYFCEFSNTEICSGEEVTFTHNFEGVAPWTLEYYLGGVLMSFTTSENPYIVTQAFTETTYYEPVHIYSGNGCDEGVSQFTTIEVHPLPTFTYELSAIEICSGDEVTFTNYFTGTAPWTVEFMYNGISNSFTTSDNPQIYVGTFTETTTYEPISVTDGNGCISSLNQVNTITVNPLPTITTEYSATEVCYGETVDFTNYFTGTAPWTVEYEYNGMSGSFTTSDNPDYYSEIFYETTVNEIISVTDGNGCTTYYDSNITTITVYPLPVVGITGELAFCEGQSTVLTATEGASYDWSTGETTQSITVMMAGLYSVVVTDGNGCEGYAEVTTSYLVVTIPACPASMNVLITDPAFTITGEDPMGGIYSGTGVVGTNVFDPALAGLGGHVITYTIQDICGPQNCEFLITVSDEPITCEDAMITNFPTTADDVCEGEAYAIDFSGVIIENAVEVIWTIDPITAGEVTANVFNLNVGYVGDVTITLLAVAEDLCNDASASVDFTVHPLPLIEITGDLEFCEGEETTLTATEGVSYLWSTGEITQSITVSVSGDYSVTVTDENGCEGFAEVTVIVHPLPLVEITGDLEFCEGEETTLTATEGVSYLWSTGEITQSITVSVSGDYSVTVTDEYGCEGFAEVTVIVHPLPLVEITGDLEFCEGEETTLTATEGVSYLWSTGEITQSITVSVPGDYSVTVTDENGCEGFAEVTVIVHPLPLVEITGDLEFCEGEETTLTATEGVSYLWSTGEISQSITITMAGLYSVVVTDGNGCEGYAEVTTSYLVVTIPACPASMNVLITDPAFTITGEDPMGGIYSGAGVVGTNVFDPALAGLGGHVITYTIQDICGPQSCEFLITVSDEPITCEDATITNFPTTADDVCEGEAYAIDFTGVIIENAVEEIWTVDPITAGEVTANVFNLNVGYVGDVTITLLAVAEDLCNDASASVGFTVHPLPLIEITGDLEFCEGEETTLTATEGVSYLWSTGEITQSITVSVSGDYSVTVTDENGCEGFTEVTVIVHPLPLVEITGDLEFCEGEETTLTATEGVSYLWSTGEITQSITVSVSGDYSVTVTDENGCEGFAEVTVIVLPAPIPECPGLLEIYVNDPLLLLDMATPLGGAYSGVGVTFDGVDYYFDPSAGAGLYDIDYCYSDPVTGCEGCCQFTIKVLSIPGEGQVICMQTGWSIISSYFQPDNPQLDDIFAGLNAENKVTIMLGQNGIYWPGQNINTLGSWNVFNGYKIKMNQPGCIDITGEMPADKTVSLPSGASFVPMLCDQPIPADEIFDQPGNGLLFAFDLQNQLLYWPQGGIYTLQTLEPGIGYLVNMIQPGQVTFNCAKNSVSGYVKAQPKVYPDAPWSYDMTGSAHLISISSAALGELSKGDYVGVFTDDGVCAGFTQYNEEKGNILLVAYGDDFTTESLDGLTDNETMSFRTYHTASKVEEPTEVTFSDLMTDAGQFTEMGRSMIVKMSAGSTSIVEGKLSSISLHPNPSDGLINLTIPAMNEVLSIEVTNSSGQLVHSETIESKAVSHQLDLTGVNPGVYFVRITGNGQTVVKKVVIQ